MGYLSCKAQSSISISNPNSNPNKPNPHWKGKKKWKSGGADDDDAKAKPKPKPKMEQFHYRELEVATNHFSEQRLLGRGSHGLVYKALLPSGRLVAVKKPSYTRPELENELLILSRLRNPSLVNLVGYSSDRRLLVVEYMSNGTLYDLLHKSPKPPNWPRRIKSALEIANAILTLHSQLPPVIHRDIKSANVLIDRHSHARLGDFGLALRCYADDLSLLSTPPAGTMGYLDPGYVTPDNLSTKTDVFSFGILLLEIISGRKAIDVSHSPPSILDWAIPLIRNGTHLQIYDPRIPPPKDPLLINQLPIIAAKCVRCCRDRRPSIKQVVHALANLLPLHSWTGFVNPCLMLHPADTPFQSPTPPNFGFRITPFECGNPTDVHSSNPARPLRDSNRVYSDLGFRNNLKDLLDEQPDNAQSPVFPSKSKAASCSSSFRISSKRFVGRGRF